MSILNWFTMKSPEQRAADSAQYDRWAFPYGEEQRQRITVLLSALLPEEPPSTAMAVYLIAREGYTGPYQADQAARQGRTEEQRLQGCRTALKKQLPGPHRDKAPRYLALILADQAVGPELAYPAPEELLRRAETLAPLLRAPKRGK